MKAEVHKSAENRAALRTPSAPAPLPVGGDLAVQKAYEAAYAAKLRRLKAEEERATAEHERAALIEERRQLEAQRLELIQTRREEILQRAKAMGYRVKESKTNGQIRLVLVRNG